MGGRSGSDGVIGQDGVWERTRTEEIGTSCVLVRRAWQLVSIVSAIPVEICFQELLSAYDLSNI
jgi:hypothetical protein